MTATSGRRLSESLRKSDPLISLERTLLESSRWYSPIVSLRWKAEKMRGGRITEKEICGDLLSSRFAETSRVRDTPSGRLLFRLAPSARRTGATGYGSSPSLLKTPSAMDASESLAKAKPNPASGNSGNLFQEVANGYAFGRMSLLPTPMSTDVFHKERVEGLKKNGGKTFHSRANGEKRPNGLTDYLYFSLLPTPMAMDYRRRGPNSNQQGLSEVAPRLLLTPASSEGLRSKMDMKTLAKSKENSNLRSQIAHKIGGGTSHLNPLFVAEMMGYPLTWTILPFLTGNGERNP